MGSDTAPPADDSAAEEGPAALGSWVGGLSVKWVTFSVWFGKGRLSCLTASNKSKKREHHPDKNDFKSHRLSWDMLKASKPNVVSDAQKS